MLVYLSEQRIYLSVHIFSVLTFHQKFPSEILKNVVELPDPAPYKLQLLGIIASLIISNSIRITTRLSHIYLLCRAASRPGSVPSNPLFAPLCALLV